MSSSADIAPKKSPVLGGKVSTKTTTSRKNSLAEEIAAIPPLSISAATEPVIEPMVEAKEPLLDENEDRHVIFPIRHLDIWTKYKQHMAVFWTPEEIDLTKDMKDWEKLSENERHFIKHILGFFAGSDGIVMENLSTRFSREVQWPEVRHFYACQNLL
jgi:hypothetical protein